MPMSRSLRIFIILLSLLRMLSATGLAEQCTQCHQEEQRQSVFHSPDIVSCDGCHGGNPETTDLDEAHLNMEAYPGRMATVEKACGQAGCHEELIPIVKNSLMYTVDGMLSVTRKIFNDLPHPPVDKPLAERLGKEGADSYLRKLCVSCHLGTDRKSHKQTLKDRGGGCSGCHLKSYRKLKKGALVEETEKLTIVYGPAHPTLSLKIENDRCFGCHSRSGRISLNYLGLAEKDAIDPKRRKDFGYLPDNRLVEKQSPDIHSQAGMLCIDCHTVNDVMGMGVRHKRQQEQLDIMCEDCHKYQYQDQCQTEDLLNCLDEKSLATFSRREVVYLSLYQRRIPPPTTIKIPVTHKAKSPLLHITRDKNRLSMVSKLSEERLDIPKIKNEIYHEQKGHERLSCDSCHTAWAPQCYGCHISFDPNQKQYDHIERKKTVGRWIEKRWETRAELPTLGVTGNNKITTFIPGMNAIIQKHPNSKPFTVQYFSSTSAHTTMKKGRNCKSCHQSDLAIGVTTRWSTSPDNPLWKTPVGWVEKNQRNPGLATQPGARSFDQKERAEIQKVGVCLNCHGDEDKIYEKFKISQKNLTPLCNE
jgi:hypothetical protein